MKWFNENPARREGYFENQLRVFVNQVELLGRPLITFEEGPDEEFNVALMVSLHNSPERKIAPIKFQMALITPRIVDHINFGYTDAPRKIEAIEGEFAFILGREFSILPGSWEKVGFSILVDTTEHNEKKNFACAVRIFTDWGVVDYPFQLVKLPKLF